MRWLKAGLAVLLIVVVGLNGWAVMAQESVPVAPADMNYIAIYPDYVSAASGQLNLTWNMTYARWDISRFPECSISIRGPNAYSFKIVNPVGNRTKTGFKVSYNNALLPPGVYKIALSCQIIDGRRNQTYCDQYNWTAHYDPDVGGCPISRNLDTTFLWVRTTKDTVPIQNYINAHSNAWKAGMSTSGRSWNLTWGVPI